MAAMVLGFAILCILGVAIFAAMRGKEEPRKPRAKRNIAADDDSINVMLFTQTVGIDHSAASTPACEVSTSIDCGSSSHGH